LIQAGGIPMITGIVFAETGLMVGFFLPGDSLLVTAGIFAAAGYLELGLLLVVVTIAGIVGDQTGYWFGRKTGPALFKREDSLLFKKHHVQRAHDFYEKYGSKTIVIARFLPMIRTFAPIVAGIAQMNYRKFVFYNIAGGILWVFSMVLGGYFLGSAIPNIDKRIHWVIAAVIVLSFVPVVLELIKANKKRFALVKE
jgi:membrane-associated protein